MKFLLRTIFVIFTLNFISLGIMKKKTRRYKLRNSNDKSKSPENTFINEQIELKNYGTVYLMDGKFKLSAEKIETKDSELVAECFFNKVLNEKGWDKVSISTYKVVNSYQQAYMAGYLEGRMTSEDIFNFYDNLRQNNMKKKRKSYEKMLDFFKKVAESFSKKVELYRVDHQKLNKNEKKFWSRIILGWTQLEGLMQGYNYEVEKRGMPEKKLSVADFLILQADGEVPELLRYFKAQPALQNNVKLGDENYFQEAFGIKTKDPIKFWGQLMWTSKCSAFIKLVKDSNGKWSDLLAGHTTWTEYFEMIRSYKYYKFELESETGVEKSEITFSSYPGCISSTDDFFLTNHNLLVMETTLELIDIGLYSNVKKPEDYIPNFTRVLAATRFAKSAKDWAQYFSRYNSGTYSSQWMIIDYKLFGQLKGTSVQKPHLLYMMEQTPERIIYHDISNYLYNHGFFGSFNRAFLRKTKNDLHMAMIKFLYGNRFGYSGANRAKIINAMQDKVVDINSLKDLLRYNGYKQNNFPNDPSATNPGEAISARYDLEHFGLKHLSGGIDCKVTNYELSQKLSSVAVSGPTNENNPNLQPFQWEEQEKNYQKIGVPNKFNFPYILMSPKTICCDNVNDIYTFNK